MLPLTPQRLASNAYRTLGISASSNQADIEAAARKMRIWPDPARIPPTPFDLPSLGPIGRTRNDIEQAVARLNDPAARVEERLLWYHTAPQASPEAPVAVAAADAPVSITENHTAALSLLHNASCKDPNVANVDLWRAVMERLAVLSASSEFQRWQTRLETDGDFDKRASETETIAAVASLPIALSDALIPKAQEAIDRNDLEACAKIIALLRRDGAAHGGSDSVEGILGRLEDAMGVQCRELEHEIRDKLRTNHNEPQPFYAANYSATLIGARKYNDDVLPLFTQLRKLSERDKDRQLRVRTTCAEILALLGLGWEWSGQFVLSEQTLQHGLELAEGTAVEPGIRKDLERVGPRAAQERFFGVASQPAASITYHSPGPAPVRSKPISSGSGTKGKIGGGVFALYMLIKLLIAFSNGASSSSSSGNSGYGSPSSSIPSGFQQSLRQSLLTPSSSTLFPATLPASDDPASIDAAPQSTTRPFDFGETIREP